MESYISEFNYITLNNIKHKMNLQYLKSDNLCKLRLKTQLLKTLSTLVKTTDEGKLFQKCKNLKVIFSYISVTKWYYQAFTITTQI